MTDFEKEEGVLPVWQKVLIGLGAIFQMVSLYICWTGNWSKYIEIANTIDLGIFAISATYLTYLYKKRKQKYCHVAVIHLMELVGVVAFIQLLKLI